MKFFGAKTLIAFVMVCLTICVIMTAMTFGLIPNRYEIMKGERVNICKTIALHASSLVSRGSREGANELLRMLVDSRNDVISAGLRRKDSRLWMDVGKHAKHWNLPPSKQSTDAEIKTPLMGATQHWGQLEVCFKPLRKSGFFGLLQSPFLQLIVFTSVSCFLLYVVFLSRMLRGMDPSKAVPDRVRSALNVLAEGLVVLDQNERIMLANSAFEEILGLTVQELQGRRISTLPWEVQGAQVETYPWSKALKEGTIQSGTMFRLQVRGNESRTFLINAAPVRNAENDIMGVVVSLEDITPLEKERNELNKTLIQLKHSREEISRQNEELRILATLDPLTGCLNRRSFFEQFDVHWKTSQRYDFPISCVMVDLDHFKEINDTWGHSQGDNVLRGVSGALQKTMRDCDAVCRYGGEEFCILLPHIDLDHAFLAAERFRSAVEQLEFDGFAVT
ncbi:MAG: diguanylate cyclase, partial [Thermoguttaceae bacterium]